MAMGAKVRPRCPFLLPSCQVSKTLDKNKETKKQCQGQKYGDSDYADKIVL